MPESIKYYLIGFVIAFLLLGAFILLLSVSYSKRQARNREEKQKMQSQFAQTLLQSQLEIQEQTLRHISHELHDNLGQVASLIKINLTTLQLDDATKATEKIEITKDLTRQLIADLKSLSVSLGADRIAQTGLAKALETEVDRLNKTGQFTATLAQVGQLPTIENDKAVILFRMAQEVLNNMVKHSGAKQIALLLKASGNLFTLAFSDDGVGFDIDEKKNSGGAGLQNLQNRAKLINAQLNIHSTPGNGTSVTIELPL
jgi:signal transduction histidine kinase